MIALPEPDRSRHKAGLLQATSLVITCTPSTSRSQILLLTMWVRDEHCEQGQLMCGPPEQETPSPCVMYTMMVVSSHQLNTEEKGDREAGCGHAQNSSSIVGAHSPVRPRHTGTGTPGLGAGMSSKELAGWNDCSTACRPENGPHFVVVESVCL